MPSVVHDFFRGARGQAVRLLACGSPDEENKLTVLDEAFDFSEMEVAFVVRLGAAVAVVALGARHLGNESRRVGRELVPSVFHLNHLSNESTLRPSW